MTRHKSETFTLGQIIEAMDSEIACEWWTVIGVDLGDYDPKTADLEEFLEKELAYVDGHRDDLYLVSWPDHVINPRFNSDASYQQILRDQNVTEVIERNGSFYYFGEGGFTVKLWRSPSEMQLVIRGLIAPSPQDAVKQARYYYGLNGEKLFNVQVYRGNDGWYDKSECIFEASEVSNEQVHRD